MHMCDGYLMLFYRLIGCSMLAHYEDHEVSKVLMWFSAQNCNSLRSLLMVFVGNYMKGKIQKTQTWAVTLYSCSVSPEFVRRSWAQSALCTYPDRRWDILMWPLCCEAVSGGGPAFGLFEDKSPSAFLKMTYPNILVPKFNWHIQLFLHFFFTAVDMI